MIKGLVRGNRRKKKHIKSVTTMIAKMQLRQKIRLRIFILSINEVIEKELIWKI